jgi:hypothetical protein
MNVEFLQIESYQYLEWIEVLLGWNDLSVG